MVSSGTEGIWIWETYRAEDIKGRRDLPLGRRALAEVRGEVTLVWKKKSNSKSRQKWVVVAESAALRRTGAKGGMGLYAWKDFRLNEIIGRYSGEEIDKAETLRRVKAGVDKLLVVERKGGREVAVDGTDAGAPYLQMANDGRGLKDEQGRKVKNSARVDHRGVMRSMRHAGREQGDKWRAMEGEGGWEAALQRELLWAYGNKYWEKKQREGEERDGEGKGSGRATPADSEDTQQQQALAGGMMWEAGLGKMLGRAGQQRGKIMFVTQVWVHEAVRREGWAREAILREGHRVGAVEVHLIARDEEARAAYTSMGMATASEEEVRREETLAEPNLERGEQYMHGQVSTMTEMERQKGHVIDEQQGRTVIRKKGAAASVGRWYEKAYMQALGDMYKGEKNWRDGVMPNKNWRMAARS